MDSSTSRTRPAASPPVARSVRHARVRGGQPRGQPAELWLPRRRVRGMRRHRGARCSFSERPPICSAGRGGDLDERGGCRFAPGTMGSTFFADPSGVPEFLKATDTEGTTFEEALGSSTTPLRTFQSAPSARGSRDPSAAVGRGRDGRGRNRGVHFEANRAAPARAPSGEWPPGRRPYCGRESEMERVGREWRTALEARRIRVEIGDQWFLGSGSTRAHHQEKETERGK